MTELEKALSGLSACACMGPMYGDPYCYCEMERRKLPLSPIWEIENQRAKEQMKQLVESGFFSQVSRPK